MKYLLLTLAVLLAASASGLRASSADSGSSTPDPNQMLPGEIPTPVAQPPAPDPNLSGHYVDAAGGKHSWSISKAHTLVWDDAPWVPIGLTFSPASWSAGGSPAPLSEDARALESLKTAGITDLLVGAPTESSSLPGPVATAETRGAGGLKVAVSGLITEQSPSLVDVPASAVQPLLDRLDQDGFRYGLRIDSPIRAPLEGYSFGESALLGTPDAGGGFSALAPPGSTGALYVARGARSVVQMGLVTPRDGVFLVNPPPGVGSVYFIQRESWDQSRGAVNLWDGFTSCTDQVLFGLHGLKMGPGLRFLLNPIAGPLISTGRAADLYPASHHFQIDFEAWLRRKYLDISALCDAWKCAPGAIPDFETASRLVPDLSVAPDALWDPQANSITPVAASISGFWADFVAFRAATARHSMDTLASSLRRNIADVPVVFTWDSFDPLYENGTDPFTFDGLAVREADHFDRETRQAAYACAQVTDAPQRRWFIVYGGKDPWTLGALGSLVDLGVKGFFLDPQGNATATAALARMLRSSISGGLPTPPTPAPVMVSPPVDQIGPALAPAAPSRDRSRRRGKKRETPPAKPAPERTPAAPALSGTYADYWPRVLPFPWDLRIASVQRLPDGTWWLPSFKAGEAIGVGPGLQAYRISGSSQVVIWSASGPQTVHMALGKSPQISWPEDQRLPKPLKGLYALDLTELPLVLDDADPSGMFPLETVDKLLDQAELLKASPLLDQQNHQLLDLATSNARRLEKSGLYYDAYERLNGLLDGQRQGVLPYIWLEGEKATQETFNGTAAAPQCSGGAYLWLNDPDDPPVGRPFKAQWRFTVAASGSYEVWMGGTPPGQDWSSSVDWALDGAPAGLNGHAASGLPYPPLFHWCPLGPVQLTAGDHTLSVTVTGRRLEPDRAYYLGIDALVFIPSPAVCRTYVNQHGIAGVTSKEMSTIDRAARAENQ